MTKKGAWPGTWATVCDVCGFRFPSNQLKLRWDNLMVCKDDWEIKHPQLFVKVSPEEIAPPWVRPSPQPQYLLYCTLITRQGVAGLGVAGCATAGVNNNLPNQSI